MQDAESASPLGAMPMPDDDRLNASSTRRLSGHSAYAISRLMPRRHIRCCLMQAYRQYHDALLDEASHDAKRYQRQTGDDFVAEIASSIIA